MRSVAPPVCCAPGAGDSVVVPVGCKCGVVIGEPVCASRRRPEGAGMQAQSARACCSSCCFLLLASSDRMLRIRCGRTGDGRHASRLHHRRAPATAGRVAFDVRNAAPKRPPQQAAHSGPPCQVLSRSSPSGPRVFLHFRRRERALLLDSLILVGCVGGRLDLAPPRRRLCKRSAATTDRQAKATRSRHQGCMPHRCF
jgi:hypothetical protein